MNALDQVPFQTLLGPVEEAAQPMTAPDIIVPDCTRILQGAEYGFKLERWVLSGQLSPSLKPSCPPYWLLSGSTKESCRAAHRGIDAWGPSPRPRSHSLNSGLHQRTVKFLISDTEDEDGYCEDNEGSSSEDASRRVRERPRGDDAHPHSCVHHCRRGSAPSLRERRQPVAQPEPPKRSSRKKERSLSGRGFLQGAAPARPSPRRLQQQQQQRPSSAGALVKNRRQVLRSGATSGLFFDSAAELLSALSQEERELLEAVTESGYPLRTAIVALQKTGYRSAEKILRYLEACNHLCELGYDEVQVEEALEMFQNCESKAAEFLRLLNQFNEMGFQQNAIKEVLLVHENHRERALEELMTRMA